MKADIGPELLRRDGYSYFAFISYRRTDSFWASWLKRRLQSYRLPQRTRKRRQELPQRFNAVFLDKTNLTPGILDERLRSEVQASKFLIVICSRSAKEKPEYLDQEIRFFLDGGGSPSRIIPFIVDDAPRPETECFPPMLQELCRQQTILGANVHDSGRRDAFLKVIAYMHGLRLEEIENDDHRRRRRTLALSAAGAAAALAGLGFGIYCWWDYNAPKTAYFQDYVERCGLPEGIGPLDEEQLAAAASHYTIVTSRRKVRELRYENAVGKALSHSGTADHDRPTRAVYEYAEDDTLDKVSWYDENGEPVMVLKYANLQTVDLQTEQSDSYVSSASLRAPNPLESGASGPDIPPNVTRYLLDYDAEGFVTELRYVSNPAYNDAASDPDGVAGYRYERDALGRVVKLWYLAYVGERGSARYSEDYEVVGLKNGVSGIGFVYNAQNELEEYCYLDRNGAPIRNSHGFSSAKLRCDEHHNQIETRYFDAEGNAVRQSGGFAVYAVDYDGHGNRIASRFCDTAGNPVRNTDGYAEARVRYDEQGRMLEASFFGPDGQPTQIVDGCAAVRFRYDENGLLTEQSWFGVDGEPILNAEGCAKQSWEYDENGRIVGTSYYGTDGERCLTRDGFAEKRLTLDERGRCVRLCCYGTDGTPCLTENGYSAFEQQYDEAGNLEALRFFGVDGAPIAISEGYAVLQYVFDERGNPIAERYFGENGEKVCSRDGCAELRRVFNDAGSVTETRYYGVDGALTLLPEGYAVLRQAYDRQGNCVETRCLDTGENPISNADGYAIKKQQYDERGNLIRSEYFGPDGQPTLIKGGYASCSLQLDGNGQIVEIAYCGVDGKAVTAENGYAYAIYEYDANGRTVTEGYFDEEERLTLCRAGYAICRIFYDENGPIQADFYDTEQNYIGSQTEFD